MKPPSCASVFRKLLARTQASKRTQQLGGRIRDTGSAERGIDSNRIFVESSGEW